MKTKALHLLLILTSLFGYLEWGKDNSAFLFQTEWEILSKLFSDPIPVLHPFTMLPMFGQLLLLITLFQEKPARWLALIGMGGIGLLLGFIFVIGLLSMNTSIVLSTMPFIAVAILTISHHRKTATKTQVP